MNIFVRAARFLSLRLHASKAPTGFVPLSKVHAASVFIDADEPGVQGLAGSVKRYFSSKGIRVCIFAVSSSKTPAHVEGATVLGRRDVNWFGKPRSGGRHPRTAIGEDLFVNLLGRYVFTAEYCATVSKAAFKVARSYSSKGTYDLLVSSEGFDQNAVFTQMTGLLDTVK